MNLLSNAAKYDFAVSKSLARVIAVITFMVLMALGAYIRIPLPFTPVPVTMQTAFLLFGSAVLGKKHAFFAVTGYLVLGLAGAPVFQNYGYGYTHIMGATGGYLVGFILAAYLIGKIIDRVNSDTNTGHILLSMFLGQVVVYTSGLIWLSVSLNIGLLQSVHFGLLPFIPGMFFKLITAAFLYKKFGQRIKNQLF